MSQLELDKLMKRNRVSHGILQYVLDVTNHMFIDYAKDTVS